MNEDFRMACRVTFSSRVLSLACDCSARACEFSCVVVQVLESEMTNQDSGAKIDGVDVAQVRKHEDLRRQHSPYDVVAEQARTPTHTTRASS